MALIGLSLNIPNVLGNNLIIDKISRTNLPVGVNPDIVVSESNPVAFFLIYNDIFEDNNEGKMSFLEFPKDKCFGFEFCEYILNKDISDNLIKDKLNDQAIGFCQQLHWGDNLTINIKKMFKPSNKKELEISNIHINPIVPSLPLVNAEPFELHYKKDLSFMTDEDTFHRYVIEKDSSGFRAHRARINKVFQEKGIDKNIKMPDFKDDIDVKSALNNIIMNRSFWYSSEQYKQDVLNFKNSANDPIITEEDKKNYLSQMDKNIADYAKSFDLFYPSFINFHPNFKFDMVGVNIYKDRFYLAGLDDTDLIIEHNFNSVEKAKEYLINKNIKVITQEIIDDIKSEVSKSQKLNKRPKL